MSPPRKRNRTDTRQRVGFAGGFCAPRSICAWFTISLLLVVLALRLSASDISELMIKTIPGTLLTKEGKDQVRFQFQTNAEVDPTTPLGLEFGSVVRTLRFGRASGKLTDLSLFRLKPLTRLMIVKPSQGSQTAAIKLDEGEVYVSSRGPPQSIPISTPHAD